MNTTAWIIVVAIILLALAFVIQQWSILRATKAVIKIFRKKNAVGHHNAKSLDELRLQPKQWYQRITGMRDFKPMALRVLIENGIIMSTDDGRLYLSEEKLATTRLKGT